jgi:hypothetical protein
VKTMNDINFKGFSTPGSRRTRPAAPDRRVNCRVEIGLLWHIPTYHRRWQLRLYNLRHATEVRRLTKRCTTPDWPGCCDKRSWNPVCHERNRTPGHNHYIRPENRCEHVVLIIETTYHDHVSWSTYHDPRIMIPACTLCREESKSNIPCCALLAWQVRATFAWFCQIHARCARHIRDSDVTLGVLHLDASVGLMDPSVYRPGQSKK